MQQDTSLQHAKTSLALIEHAFYKKAYVLSALNQLLASCNQEASLRGLLSAINLLFVKQDASKSKVHPILSPCRRFPQAAVLRRALHDVMLTVHCILMRYDFILCETICHF
jgi:hypothetical protein